LMKLNSGDESRISEAVEEIQQRCRDLDLGLIEQMQSELSEGLIQTQPQMAVELLEWGILELAEQTDRLWTLQLQRTKAYVALGQNEQALAAAKSCFSVAGMQWAGTSMQVVEFALQNAHPGGEETVRQFKREQVLGAELVEGLDEMQARRSEVLAGIEVDPQMYDEALDRLKTAIAYETLMGQRSARYTTLKRKGNLLLMADRVPEARVAMEEAYAVAPEELLVEATENLARVIKAEDGTIGRANVWLLSLRPKPAG
jgi:tetratricopeptide (TPR) repeat protein